MGTSRDSTGVIQGLRRDCIGVCSKGILFLYSLLSPSKQRSSGTPCILELAYQEARRELAEKEKAAASCAFLGEQLKFYYYKKGI